MSLSIWCHRTRTTMKTTTTTPGSHLKKEKNWTDYLQCLTPWDRKVSKRCLFVSDATNFQRNVVFVNKGKLHLNPFLGWIWKFWSAFCHILLWQNWNGGWLGGPYTAPRTQGSSFPTLPLLLGANSSPRTMLGCFGLLGNWQCLSDLALKLPNKSI